MSWNQLHPRTRERAQRILTRKQLTILQDRLNGHSWRRIADAHAIHEATARSHYRAALDRLRKDNP